MTIVDESKVFLGNVSAEDRLTAIRKVMDDIHSQRNGTMWRHGVELTLVPADLMDDLLSACWDATPGVPDDDED